MSAVWTLLRYHWWRHRVPLIPMAVSLALFEFLLTRIAPAPDEVSWIAGILAAVPPQLLALIGDDVAAGSPSGFLAIGYGHPFFFLLLSVWVVRVSSRVLAGEIGGGTMDLVAARPVARWVHLAAGFVALAAGLAVLTGAAWTGTAIGLAVRPLGLAGSPFLPFAATAWLLFLTFGAVGLLVSATQRDGGAAIGWLSGIIAASFVLDYLARLWTTIAAVRPLSLFACYNPQHIVKSGPELIDIARLAGVAAVAVIASVLVFKRRDL
jgi:ABC-type transport system involved in multi-copper enzyme maturation permease subunit